MEPGCGWSRCAARPRRPRPADRPILRTTAKWRRSRAISRVVPRFPHVAHRCSAARSTGRAMTPVARERDVRDPELAERNCGAAGRATGRQAGGRLSGDDGAGATRRRVVEGGGKDDRATFGWATSGAWPVLHLEGSGPPTDLVQGAVFRATGAPPSSFRPAASLPAPRKLAAEGHLRGIGYPPPPFLLSRVPVSASRPAPAPERVGWTAPPEACLPNR